MNRIQLQEVMVIHIQLQGVTYGKQSADNDAIYHHIITRVTSGKQDTAEDDAIATY